MLSVPIVVLFLLILCQQNKRYWLNIRKIAVEHIFLDVGAAGGLFLKVAKDHGYNVLGVEPNVNLAKVASGTYGVKVVASAFESTQFRQKFDIITFWDTLEHINNPKSTLASY